MIDPKAVVENAARELLRALSALPVAPRVRVASADGHVACLIQVWGGDHVMPTATSKRRKRATGGRDECRTDILAVVTAAGQARTQKEIVRELKLAGKAHGPGTVVKALADLTTSGVLVNPRDKKGYRLAGWRRNKTPSLFD
ncbi:hypothetical protein VT84_33785 [Gemmata sp. SH-PL17]|uniref:hypothetical protein n=1 Tax=Gemmata sp. SH-PL17 TaxID=1630693 RepID=UPI00078EAB01|nr:hypothetical protein [Gemmata sp. SH-PL17]AMV29415.1 hypothetical protein VT84_33785 [Gemmata sp. SH-PL17]